MDGDIVGKYRNTGAYWQLSQDWEHKAGLGEHEKFRLLTLNNSSFSKNHLKRSLILHFLFPGKHMHPFGDRVLRGMVDEFFIFDCPLPRLEILVLMHHCKVYFSKCFN